MISSVREVGPNFSTTAYQEKSGSQYTLSNISTLSSIEIYNDDTTSTDKTVLLANTIIDTNPINETNTEIIHVPQQAVVTGYIGLGKNWRIKADRTKLYFQFNGEPSSSSSSWRDIPFIKNKNINTTDIENVITESSENYTATLNLLNGWANKFNRSGLYKAAFTLQYNIYANETAISYLNGWNKLHYNILTKTEAAKTFFNAPNAPNNQVWAFPTDKNGTVTSSIGTLIDFINWSPICW